MKYKDLRMLIITGLLNVVVVAMMIYFAIDHNMKKMIIGLVIFFILIMMTLTKFNSHIFYDSMLVYEYKGIAILPKMIEYKDINQYELLSKHKLRIQHKGNTTLYLVDAEAFKKELDEKYLEYKTKEHSQENDV